jgi:hypothetical protein
MTISLEAKVLVPTRIGSPSPPSYMEIDRPLERLVVEAKTRSVAVNRLEVGEWLTLGD